MTQFLVMDAAQAETLRGPTGPGAELAPREVSAGAYAGSFVLPASALDDPAHASKLAELEALPVVEIDPSAAWPPKPFGSGG